MDNNLRRSVVSNEQTRQEALNHRDHPLAAPWRGFNWEETLPAAIWLVFCIFPIRATLTAPISNTLRTGTITLFLAFAAFYIFTFGAHRYYPRGISNSSRVLIYGGVFLLFLLAIWLVAGLATLSFVCYFVGFLAFIFRRQHPRAGLFLIAATILLATAIGIAVASDMGDLLLVVSLATFSPLIVYMLSVLSKRQEEKAILTQKLQLAEERERIAADLHDLLGNTLTVIHLKSEVAERMLARDTTRAAQEINEITQLARQSLSEVRAAVTRIQSPDLEGEINASYRALSTANIAFHITGEPKIAGKNDGLFAWIIREGITNVIRHSEAKNCWVDIVEGKIQVQDDGVGWVQRGVIAEKEGGLNGLRKRITLAGGSLIIHSAEGKGTTLLVSMTGDREWIRAPHDMASSAEDRNAGSVAGEVSEGD